jgi:hypothetical protein
MYGATFGSSAKINGSAGPFSAILPLSRRIRAAVDTPH